MLQSINAIIGCRLMGSDGELGKSADVYLDANEWMIRYFVVKTGSWLSRREVLVSPAVVERPDLEAGSLHVRMTEEEVKNSPESISDLPVSRQNEIELMRYYGWTRYGGPIGKPEEGRGAGPSSETRWPKDAAADWDPHLRSVDHIQGYGIQAVDGLAGRLENLAFEEEDWSVRYLIIEAGSMLSRKRVLVSTAWVNRIDGVEGTVHVDLKGESIRNGPEFDYRYPIDFKYEVAAFDHFLQNG
jgi:hypothetical protein